MPYLLSIETATPSCSVAIHHDDRLLACHSLHVEKSHSGFLAVLIKDMLGYCKLVMTDLSAVAVSGGPGSYTGLRIGTSTAKGLAYSLQIPLIAVNTLEALARQIPTLDTVSLCPMLDARRMEVYSMVVGPNHSIIQPTEAVVVDESSYVQFLEKGRVLFFGSGAEKCKEVIMHVNAVFRDDVFPSAATVGSIAFDKFHKGEFEDVAYYEPFYLKEFRPTKPKIS